MRLDARKGDVGWQVWHAELCCPVDNVIWIDSDSAEYEQYIFPYIESLANALDRAVVGNGPQTRIIKAKRIVIYPERRFVVVNPIEVNDTERVKETVMLK